MFIIEDGLNLGSTMSIRALAFLARLAGVGPLVEGGTVERENSTRPLGRVFGSVVINKLEAVHQRVSSAQYCAALRRVWRSSRSFAFSRSS